MMPIKDLMVFLEEEDAKYNHSTHANWSNRNYENYRHDYALSSHEHDYRHYSNNDNDYEHGEKEALMINLNNDNDPRTLGYSTAMSNMPGNNSPPPIYSSYPGGNCGGGVNGIGVGGSVGGGAGVYNIPFNSNLGPSNPLSTGQFPINPSSVIVNPLDEAARITCPFCNKFIVTKTFKQAGCMTYSACFLLVFLGCFWGPCLIPFCIRGMNDIKHKCPNCKQTIAIYRRI